MGGLPPTPSADGPVLSSMRQLEVIERSRHRCAGLGIRESAAPAFDAPRRGDWYGALERTDSLRRIAMPVMTELHDQLASAHSMIVLTDGDGLILQSLGDDGFLERARKVALSPGVCWSESEKGTNAIGTAIVEKQPTLVHGDQHFLTANHFLTCSATPIFSPDGAVAGVLDVTGDHRSYRQHAMALVRMSATAIENRLVQSTARTAIRLRFHRRPEFVGTVAEGIAAFDRDGLCLGANRAGQAQLGLQPEELRGRPFDLLFGIGHEAALMRSARMPERPIALYAQGDIAVFALVEHVAPLRGAAAAARPAARGDSDERHGAPGGEPRSRRAPSEIDGPVESRGRNGAEATAAAPPAAAYSARATARGGVDLPSGPPAMRTRPAPGGAQRGERIAAGALDRLDTGDPVMHAVLQKVRRILGRDIPILISGETGTGKELLAKAIHAESPRAEGPFVAVNCASIPEALIESELFGYDEGAFTGARRRGYAGRIVQSHGGTLFLDEIGDMPLPLQARLLRVLQDRTVTPLGSQRAVPVDVLLVCATHRNLRELVSAGHFREDLYYRLNGLTVKLPPLREREDLDRVVERVLEEVSPDRTPPRVSAAVASLMRSYRWPGNMRQLANLLRTACAMAEGEGEIRADHLPDDFLEELDLAAARALPGSAPPDVPGGGLEQIALQAIEQALRANAGNVSVTARQLGISRNTIYRKLRQAGLRSA